MGRGDRQVAGIPGMELLGKLLEVFRIEQHALSDEQQAFPGLVMAVTRLPLRTKISIPGSSSRNLICLLMAGCEVNSAVAVSEIFGSRRTISLS